MAYQSQDYQDALAQAEQTVSDSSTDYREWIWLGQLRWAANQPAEPSFRRAIELAGNKSPDAWPALVTYLAATDPKKAEAAVAEAEAKLSQSKDPQARLALAECYRLIGQSDQGLVVFDTVLKANPDDPQNRDLRQLLEVLAG
jgi:cytochrome c-type biogenesis protein CcmH/NrfG